MKCCALFTGLALLAACSPATRRPAFAPMPEARRG